MNAKEEIQSLTEKLISYQDTYYKEGVSLVSDSEYDRLTDRLIELEKEYPEYALPSSPTRRVGSDLTSDFPEVEHTIPVLSLDKAYSKDEVLSFFSRSIEKEGGALSFVAEEKIDGISMVLYYEDGILTRAVTRGNGSVGNDVTPNIVTIKSVPLELKEKVDIAVRGEVYLPKADFEKVNASLPEDEKAANARNLAAGTVRRQKSSDCARVPLDMYCYEGFWSDKSQTPEDHLHILSKLKELGFRINPDFAYIAESEEEAKKALERVNLGGSAYSFSSLSSYIERMTEKRPTLDHEIDGLVFKINELDVREKFGYTVHHPRWAIAYKFESPHSQSKLLSVTCQVGRTGRITPVAEIEPVALGGSTIRRATLHNQEYIDELELAVGDTVSITKRGDVIPAVEEVIEKNEEGNTTYKLPTLCPCCSTPLEKRGAHTYCPNFNCPDQAKGRLSYFASRDQMDIDTLGPKTIDILFSQGILKNTEDIYTADYTKAVGLPGIGEKTVSSIIESVKKSKEQPFKTVLASLGIPEIAKKSAEILIAGGFDNIDKIIQAATSDDIKAFTSIKGMGEETAANIIKTFKDENFMRMVNALRESGLHFSVDMDKKEEEKEKIFSGEVWCVTGSFASFNPRSKALEEIEKRGGRTVSSVTGKTTHLLVGTGGGSKRADAERLGVKIVDEKEFLSLIGREEESEINENKQGFLF